MLNRHGQNRPEGPHRRRCEKSTGRVLQSNRTAGNNPTIEKRKGIASANPRKRILSMQRSLEPKNGTDRQLTDRGELPVPTNPVIMATLRAIYAGGSKPRWQSNSFGRPYYRHEARDGEISLFFESPPQLQISHQPVLYFHSPNGFRLFGKTSTDRLPPVRGDCRCFPHPHVPDRPSEPPPDRDCPDRPR